ncbi:uncharacterized protein LOC125004174 isoform X2 [Mugil cephalus]|uniref:uncharacterized protein LOC125004174 isoform X2 n=1 Tax=Mugil cephalus TaxID=48193 RepID=UPI001FB5C6C3|nr:uncharacterized protein LOC125004174 isoform X2 [Mugil cephalus]
MCSRISKVFPTGLLIKHLHVEISTRADRPQVSFLTSRGLCLSMKPSAPQPPGPLCVSRGNVFHFLCVVGGLMMGATAGGQCLDVAVTTAQDPKNLRRMSNTLIGLLGLGYRTNVTLVKQNLKRLYFSESFRSFLGERRIFLPVTCDFHFSRAFPVKQTNLESTSRNWISTKRCSTHYILFCGGSSRLILILCFRGRGLKIKTYRSSNQMQRLITFSREVRGDVIFLLLDGLAGKAKTGRDANDAANHPTRLTLGLSALSVLLLWMFLPRFALCATIGLALNAPRHTRRTVLPRRGSE